MRGLPAAFAMFATFGVVANAADREFKDVVRAIADEYHAQPTHIPLFGLINTFTFMARPAGTKHMDVAVFEDLNTDGHDPTAIAERIRAIAGRSWRPFVQVRSNRKGAEEATLVYMRADGNDFRMLVTAIEKNEATVVQLNLSRSALIRWIENPAGEASDSRTGDR